MAAAANVVNAAVVEGVGVARQRPGETASPTTTTCSTAGLAQFVLHRDQALERGDQHAHVAVAEDVADLLGSKQGVDRDEHAAGGRGAQNGDHVLVPLVEVDGHTVAALEAER